MRFTSSPQRIMRTEDAKPASYTNGSNGGSSGRSRGRDTEATDSDLIQRFLYAKDQSAFTAIVERYSRLVLGVALRHVRDRNRAEDVFQATFLVLAENARKIRKRPSLASWLHGVARRIALRTMSEMHRENMWESTMEPASPLFAGVGESFERQTLDEELAQLPEKYRDPITLHYLEGLSHEEIGKRLGLSVAAVDGRLKRARKDLRLRLARRGVSLSVAIGVFHFSQQAASAATFSTLVTSTSVAAQALAAGTAVSTCTPNAVLLAGKEITAMAAMKSTMLVALAGVCCLAAGLVIAGGDGPGTGAGVNSGDGTGEVGGLTSLLDDGGATIEATIEGGTAEAGGLSGGSEGGQYGSGSADTGGFTGDSALLPGADPLANVKIYHLHNTSASDVVEILRTLIPNLSPQIAADERTNSVLANTTEEQQQIIEAILLRLDDAAATAGASGGGGDAAGGFGSMSSYGRGGSAGGPMGPMGGGPADGQEGMTGAGMMMGMGMPGMGGMGPNGPTSIDYGTQSENRDRIEAALTQETRIEFHAMPVTQAMDYISELHEIPILVDVQALAEQGGTIDIYELTFTTSGLPLVDALDLMLKDNGSGDLGYLIQNNVLMITTAEAADQFMETRLYEMRNYQGLNPTLATQLIQEGTSGEWKNMGGAGGSIVPIQGGVMVRQNQRVHREIHSLLEQLQRFSSTGLETPIDWQHVDGSGYSPFPGMMGGGGMYGAGSGRYGGGMMPGGTGMGAGTDSMGANPYAGAAGGYGSFGGEGTGTTTGDSASGSGYGAPSGQSGGFSGDVGGYTAPGGGLGDGTVFDAGETAIPGGPDSIGP